VGSVSLLVSGVLVAACSGAPGSVLTGSSSSSGGAASHGGPGDTGGGSSSNSGSSTSGSNGNTGNTTGGSASGSGGGSGNHGGSASSSDGGSGNTGGSSGSGSGGSSGGSCASGAASCAAQDDGTASGQQTCVSCCQTSCATGAGAYFQLAAACLCNGGPCTGACAGSGDYCVSPGSVITSTCDTCVTTNTAAGAKCSDASIEGACAADAQCAAYVSCVNACP
jgi:hypothetical protein